MSENEPQADTNTDDDHSPGDGHDRAGLHVWQYRWVRDILVILCVLLLLRLGQTISVVTVPVLLAILFAYLFEPVVAWVMQRFKFKRSLGVGVTLAAVITLIVVPVTIGLAYGTVQAVGLSTRVIASIDTVTDSLEPPYERRIPSVSAPDFETRIQAYEDGREFVRENAGDAWVWVRDKVVEAESGESDLGQALSAIIDWIEANAERLATTAAGAGRDIVRLALGFTAGVFGLLFMGFLTAFFFFFVSTSWVDVKDFLLKLLPSKHRSTATDLAGKFDGVISGFIRGRLIIAFLQSIVFTAGYLAIGVPAAFILGPAVAVLSVVPYLALVGVPISISLMLLESHTGFRGEWWWIFGAPTVFYFVAQALDDYIWTPRIQGEQTGMSTPAILFASIAGGVLFGVFGLLIAIPIAACLKIAADELFWPRFHEWAEGRAEDPLPVGED